MGESEKITIIEGPPPTFVLSRDAWLLGLTEGWVPFQVAICRVRTFNGPALVERCFRAWRESQTINLEFRGQDGLTHQAPIVAARWTEGPEGDLLSLWVRLEKSEIKVEFDFDILDLDDDLGVEGSDAGFDLIE
jgi:hypothetical protein